jgi:hypothetical protein
MRALAACPGLLSFPLIYPPTLSCCPAPPSSHAIRCSYMLICAPQSVVRQCAQQPPVRELRPAMQLHTAVQQICVGNGSQPIDSEVCRSCSSQTFDPDKVTVQALQANCADPLGRLPASLIQAAAAFAGLLPLPAGRLAGSLMTSSGARAGRE